MLLTQRATVAVAAQLLIAYSSIAGAEPSSIQAGLIEELHYWIDTTTVLPAADTSATIVFVDAQDLAEPSEMASMIGSTPRGLYDPDTGTISLVRPWSAENPQDVAVLLHELVHHRQGGKHFYCEAAKEHAAYHVQKNWLAEREITLDVNWIAIVLASSCAVRDTHP
ncbi:hypothetical protein C1J05_19370 [Sulfitobacter sp. JL08]|uniref:DUF6647 family protein n=1 Tax=Sulfitobacter sp. JL08 TaxID=2070369 RepID=UPI000E0C9BDA|nr:DUF6647 family protein [Sulfitobacter sp. JL08]AXI56378.1 hypothetical protein C1J05_19370 [Sulfitobacter sp. JL08]